MPYILNSRRALIDTFQMPLNEMVAGDHVYQHYKAMVRKFNENKSFQTAFDIRRWVVNEILNSSDVDYITYIDMAYSEFRRRHLDMYENLKISENGDVL